MQAIQPADLFEAVEARQTAVRGRRRAGKVEPWRGHELRKVPCVRCHRSSRVQVKAAADTLHRPLCADCGRALMRAILRFLRDPTADAKARDYALRLGVELLPDVGVCERGHELVPGVAFKTHRGWLGCRRCVEEDRRAATNGKT
jgi:hypothetical protein